MSKKHSVQQAHLTQQAADELIGYLYLLIEDLQEKYCSPQLEEEPEDNWGEQSADFNDKLPF